MVENVVQKDVHVTKCHPILCSQSSLWLYAISEPYMAFRNGLTHSSARRALEPINEPYMAILKQLELVQGSLEPLSRQMAWLGSTLTRLGSQAVWSRVSGSTTGNSGKVQIRELCDSTNKLSSANDTSTSSRRLTRSRCE